MSTSGPSAGIAIRESTSRQEADRLRQRWDDLEQSTDRKAERIRSSLRRGLEQVEQDNDLSADARRRRAEEMKQSARDGMQDARICYEQRYEDLRERVVREAFGTSGPNVVAWRDAQTRAEAITDARTAHAEMERARVAGDTQLARAIAARSHRNGWRDLAERGAGTELIALLTELEQPRQKDTAAAALFRWSLV